MKPIGRGDIVGGHYGFDRLEAALAGHSVPVDFETVTALPRLYAEQGLARAQ